MIPDDKMLMGGDDKDSKPSGLLADYLTGLSFFASVIFTSVLQSVLLVIEAYVSLLEIKLIMINLLKL